MQCLFSSGPVKDSFIAKAAAGAIFERRAAPAFPASAAWQTAVT
jgi:hypothetical protein